MTDSTICNSEGLALLKIHICLYIEPVFAVGTYSQISNTFCSF